MKRLASIALVVLLPRLAGAQTATTMEAAAAAAYTLTTIALSARLTQTGSGTGVSGQSVTFFFQGTSQTVTTNGTGVATTTYAAVASSGTPQFSADFAGGGGFDPSSDLGTVTLSPRPTSVVPFNPSGFALETLTPTARLVDGLSGFGVQGKTLQLWFNGSTQTATTDALGDGATTFSAPASSNTLPFTATFSADGTYAGANNAGTATVDDRPTTLLPDNIEVPLNASFQAQARLKDTRNSANIAGASVSFVFDGSTKTATTNALGIATVTYSAPSSTGASFYTAQYVGDATYEASFESATVTTDLRNTLLVPINVTAPYQDPFLARAQLIDTGFSLGIEGVSVQLYFNGSTQTVTSGSLGIAQATFAADILPSTQSFNATFTGDAVYKGATSSGTLTITTRGTTLTPGAQQETQPGALFVASATLTDTGNGLSIATHTVRFYFPSEASTKTASTNGAGVASVSFTAPVSTGTFQYFISLDGNTIYSAAASTGSINNQQVTTALAAQNATVPAGEVMVASATLTNQANAAPVAGKTIQFLFNGSTHTATTSALGIAATGFVTSPVVQTLPIQATFAGDLTHKGSVDAALGNLTARTARVLLATATVRTSTVFTATATVLDAYDSSVVAAQNVRFTFSGSSAVAATDGSGVAASTFTAPASSGTLSLNAVFLGSALYEAVGSTLAVSVVLPPTNVALQAVSVRAHEVFTATATLTEADGGTPLATKPLSLFFAGSTRTLTTDASGVVTSTFSAPATTGTYTLSASFNGEFGVFGASAASLGALIQPRPVALTVSSHLVSALDVFTASATVRDATGPLNGLPVTFVVDSVAQVGITDALGVATTDFTAPAGQGGYTLQASFAADATYAGAVSTEAVSVLRRVTALAPSPASAFAAHVFTASATLSDKDGAVAGRALAFVFQGGTQTAVTDALGVAATAFAVPASSGSYALEVALSTDATYVGVASGTVLNVLPRPVAVALATRTVVVDEVFTASATLTDFAGPLSGRTLSFVFNGTTQTALTDALGLAATGFTAPPSSGTYTLEASAAPDATYASTATSLGVLVDPRVAILSQSSASAVIDGVFTASATLADQTGALAGSLVRFVFQGTSHTAVTDALGVAATAYTAPASSGPYTLEAYFDGDAAHGSAQSTATLSALPAPAALAAPQIDVEITQTFIASATLSATGAEPGQSVLFHFQGTTRTAVTDALGLATTSFAAPGSSGTYRLDVSFVETSTIAATSSTAAVVVAPVQTALTSPAASAPALGVFVASAALSAQGSPLNGEAVRFVFEGATQTATTDALGVAATAYAAPASTGSYGFSAYFDGTATHGARTSTAAVSVAARATVVTAVPASPIINEFFSTTATLTDVAGGVSGRTLLFHFDGTTQTATTNVLGTAATIFYTPSSTGTHRLDVSFVADATYAAAAGTETVSVLQRPTVLGAAPVSAFINQVFVASATLTDHAGAVAGKSVRFLFEGATHTATTDGLGVAATAYTMPTTSGTYRLDVAFDEDAIYAASAGTQPLAALPILTDLTLLDATRQVGVLFTASATLRSGGSPLSGETVRFLFQGTTQTALTDGLGLAATAYTTPATTGPYLIEAFFDGTATREVSSDTAVLAATPTPTALSAAAQGATALGVFVATVTLSDAGGALPGRTVRFVLEGTTQTALTDGLGVATTRYAVPASSGGHRVEFYFDETATHAASASTAAVTVAPRVTALDVLPVTTPANVLFIASATLTDADGAVAGQTVRFVFQNTTHTALTDALGLATTGFTAPVSTGSFALEARLDANATYVGSSSATTVTNNQRLTTLVVSSQAALIDAVFAASATLTDLGGPVAGQTVRFVFEGSTRTAVTDSLGLAATGYSVPATSGAYRIEAYFDETATYAASAGTEPLNALPVPTSMSGPAVQQYINQMFVTTVTLSDLFGTVAGSSVTFVFAGATQSALTDGLGTAATSFTAPASSGVYKVEFRHDESPVLGLSLATAAISVLPDPTEITGPARTAPAAATFQTSATLTQMGTPVAGETVRFVLEGTTRTALTDALGVATTAFAAPVDSGTYSIALHYDGSGIYEVSSSTAELTVSQRQAVVTVPDQTPFAADVFAASATLTDFTGAVAGQTVRFVFEGATQTATTDALGTAATGFQMPLSSGVFRLDAYLDTNATYVASSGSATVTGLPRVTRIATASVVGVVNDTFTLSATLLDHAGAVAGANLAFIFDGTTRTAVTDGLGVGATVFTAPASSGTAPFEVYFDTTATYTGILFQGAVTVAPRPTALDASSASAVAQGVYVASATLTDSAGPVSGAVIRFVVAGTSQSATTDALGVAATQYAAPAASATLTLEAYFDETAVYAAAASTDAVAVGPRPVALTAPAAAPLVGALSFAVSATLTDAQTGPVSGETLRFIFDGSTKTAATDGSGVAATVFDAPASSGTRTLDIEHDETAVYAVVVATAAIDVQPLPTVLTLEASTTTALSTFYTTATLTQGGSPVAGRTISFVFAGSTFTATTNGVGVATRTLSAPVSSGTYVQAAAFAGTASLAVAAASASVVVDPRPTALVASSITVPVGEVFTASAVVTDLGGNLAGRVVRFIFNGSTQTGTTDGIGLATTDFVSIGSSGTFAFAAFHDADATYTASSGTALVVQAPRETAFSIALPTQTAGELFTATATLRDFEAAGVAGATVRFHLEGTTQTKTTDGAGVSTAAYTAPTTSGTYVMNFTFLETSVYAATSAAVAFPVARRPVALTPQAALGSENNPFLAVANLNEVLNSTFGIVGRTLNFYFEGTTNTATTNGNGLATTVFTAPASGGQYYYFVEFPGDATYQAATSSTTLFVGQPTSLVVADVKTTVNTAFTVSGTLRDSANNPVSGASIAFYFAGSGSTHTVTTNALGVATTGFTSPALTGNYVMNTSFAGNGTLSPAVDISNVEVNLGLTLITGIDVETVINTAFNAKARLFDVGTAQPLSGRTVNFSFQGLNKSGVTDATGLAQAAYVSPPSSGTFSFDAAFPGDAAYSASNTTGTVVVTVTGSGSGQAGVKLETYKVRPPNGQVFTVRATLTDALTDGAIAGLPIDFTYLSTTTTGVTGSDGVATATFTASLAVSSATYQAQFAGGSGYSAAVSTALVLVQIPIPRDPERIEFTAQTASSATLTWPAVTLDTNDLPLGALLGSYRVQRASDLKGAWETVATVVSSGTRSYTVPVLSTVRYYRVLAVLGSGETSPGGVVAEVSAAPKVLFSDPDQLAWVRLAPALLDAIKGQGSEAAIRVSSTVESGFLRSYTFTALRDGAAIADFNLGRGRDGIEVVFNYEDLQQGAQTSAVDQLAIFFYNGVEWIKLGGKADVLTSEVSIKTNSLGKFAARFAPLATTFSLSKVAPRVFSPQEPDQRINRAVFYFEDPNQNDVAIRIYDLTGAVVRRSLLRDGTNMIYWDGKDDAGTRVRGGVYLYQIEADGKVLNGTVVVAQ